MHNIFGMHIIDSFANALKYASDHSLIFEPVLPNIIEKSAIFCVLQDYVSTLLLLVEVIVKHFYDVRMIEFHMDLYFPKCYFTANFFHCDCLSCIQAFSELDGSICAEP